MKRAARKVLLAVGGLAVLTGAALFSGRLLLIAGKTAPKVEKAYFQTAENIPPFLKPYADILAEAANDTANGRTNEAAHTAAGAAASCKNIRIYAGNWFSDSDAPDISDDAKRCGHNDRRAGKILCRLGINAPVADVSAKCGNSGGIYAAILPA